MKKYVLDTSVIRSLSNAALEKSVSVAEIVVSPLSVFEILCHLDEQIEGFTKEESFLRRRGWLLKCQRFGLLDDPFAATAAVLGMDDLADATRFEDKVIVQQLFGLLEESGNLQELGSKEVKFPNGDIRVVGDVSERCRDILTQFEARFTQRIREIHQHLVEGPGLVAARALTGKEYVSFMARISNILAKAFAELSEERPEYLGCKVLAATYPFHSYLLERTLKYADNSKDGNIVIDPNDAEDAAICLYLNMLEDWTLVTGDKGTVNALNSGLGKFQEALVAMGSDTQIVTRVLSPSVWMKELGF